MTKREKSAELLVFSNIFVGLVALSMAYISLTLQNLPGDWLLYCALFLLYVGAYNLDRSKQAEEDRINLPSRFEFAKSFGGYQNVLGITSCSFALLIFALCSIPAFCITLLTLALMILYTSKKLPLKRMTGVKNIVIALSWALSASFVVNAYMHAGASYTTLAVFIIIFFMVVINTLAFDMRDLKGDLRSGVLTVPTRLGIRKTKYALAAINGCLGCFIFLASLYGLLPIFGVLLNLNTIYAFLYVGFFEKLQRTILFDIVVDGEYLFAALAIGLGTLFFTSAL